jgi:hypothetical protein
VPENFNLNDTFIPEGTKPPAVEEIPRPKQEPPKENEAPKPPPPQNPPAAPPPIIEVPKPPDGADEPKKN